MSAAVPNAQQKILLIDDDELIAGSLRKYLVVHGFHVDVAVDACEAERLMRSNGYRVIIVDPYLTGSLHQAGEQLLSRIAQLQRGAALVVLTAYSSSELAQSAAECKVAALLNKPQSVVALNDLVTNISSPAYQRNG
jgi:DNA-binding NtrC family response regulator